MERRFQGQIERQRAIAQTVVVGPELAWAASLDECLSAAGAISAMGGAGIGRHRRNGAQRTRQLQSGGPLAQCHLPRPGNCSARVRFGDVRQTGEIAFAYTLAHPTRTRKYGGTATTPNAQPGSKADEGLNALSLAIVAIRYSLAAQASKAYADRFFPGATVHRLWRCRLRRRSMASIMR
jgi:hypothetical protein